MYTVNSFRTLKLNDLNTNQHDLTKVHCRSTIMCFIEFGPTV